MCIDRYRIWRWVQFCAMECDFPDLDSRVNRELSLSAWEAAPPEALNGVSWPRWQRLLLFCWCWCRWTCSYRSMLNRIRWWHQWWHRKFEEIMQFSRGLADTGAEMILPASSIGMIKQSLSSRCRRGESSSIANWSKSSKYRLFNLSHTNHERSVTIIWNQYQWRGVACNLAMMKFVHFNRWKRSNFWVTGGHRRIRLFTLVWMDTQQRCQIERQATGFSAARFGIKYSNFP